MEIGRIPTLEHGVSSGPVLVVDTQTLLVPDFTYDGLGPGEFQWHTKLLNRNYYQSDWDIVRRPGAQESPISKETKYIDFFSILKI